MARCGAVPLLRVPARRDGGGAAAPASRRVSGTAGTARHDLGAAAAHGARAPVCRPTAGHDHSALARSGGWNHVLHLPADHGAALDPRSIGLRAVWIERYRIDQLRRRERGGRIGVPGEEILAQAMSVGMGPGSTAARTVPSLLA